MNFVKSFIILVACVLSIAASQLVRGADPDSRPTNRKVSTLDDLQGTWVGFTGTDANGSEVTITIEGDSFRFHRDEDFWFETTIALPKGPVPQQLLATIKRSAPSQDSSIGKMVPAIFKIENGTMTIGAFADVEDPPNGFEDINRDSLYTLRLAPSKDIEGPAQ